MKIPGAVFNKRLAGRAAFTLGLLWLGLAAWVQPVVAAATVPLSASEVRPLLIGAQVPKLTLQTADGAAFDLNAAVAKQPTVIIFYRGGWCPYCNAELSELQAVDSTLRNMGYQILALSADRPAKLIESREKHNLTYTLVSDHSMKAASAFGVAFKVDNATLERYKGWHIDLEEASGEKHHELPVPSVFIVGTDGKIRFTYVNPDYRVRIDSGVLVAAAKACLKKK